LTVGKGDEEVRSGGDFFLGGRLLSSIFVFLILLSFGFAGAGRLRSLTMDVFDFDVIVRFDFGLGGGELGLRRAFRRRRKFGLLSFLEAVLSGLGVVVTRFSRRRGLGVARHGECD
jgi:hypothetical protein